MPNDPKSKITDALTDPEARTDMMSIFASKEQKRFDTHLMMGAGVYKIRHYADWMLTDRRQQMAMKAKGTTPRSEQLKEAMVSSQEKSGIYTGTGIDDHMAEKRRRMAAKPEP